MEMDAMYEQLGIERKVLEFGKEIEGLLSERFAAIDETAEYNQLKVIKAMQDNRVSDIHFAATTDTVTTTWDGIHWKMYTPACSTRKVPW